MIGLGRHMRPIHIVTTNDIFLLILIRGAHMHVRQVRQFIAVAETLNFRKAAERLNMAQPPLSIAIKRMEDDLGGALFIRERRGVRLTAMGEAILEDARQISFHHDQLRKAAGGASTGLVGTLRIGFIGSATYSLFPRVLPVFRKRFPLVELELRERTTTQILREIESDQLDLGLVRFPVFEPTHARVSPVEPDLLVVALQRDHPLARRSRLKLRDLADQRFVMYSSVAALNLRGQVMLACQTAGFTPNVVQEAIQVQTIVSLVEGGIGIAIVPSICQRNTSEQVVFRPLIAPQEHLSVAIAAVTRPEAEPRTVTLLRQVLEELSWAKPLRGEIDGAPCANMKCDTYP